MNYLVKKEVVANSLKSLRMRRTHEHFAGYLCLLYRAAAEGAGEAIQPNFAEFFDAFFRIEGRPDANPYIKPFVNTAPTTSNLWLNRNVAGSYAPSSIRSTFKKVVEVNNGGYSLRRNHIQMAQENLLHGTPINIFDLAVFLYRDYPIISNRPTIEDIVSIFAVEFGFESLAGERNSDFEILFKAPTSESPHADIFELT